MAARNPPPIEPAPDTPRAPPDLRVEEVDMPNRSPTELPTALTLDRQIKTCVEGIGELASAQGRVAAELADLRRDNQDIRSTMQRGFRHLEGLIKTDLANTSAIARTKGLTPVDPPPPEPEPLPPPPRLPYDSVSELDEEITLGGTRVLKGTPDRIRAIVDARVAVALRETQRTSDAAKVEAVRVTLKRGASAGAIGVVSAALLGVASAIYLAIKSYIDHALGR